MTDSLVTSALVSCICCGAPLDAVPYEQLRARVTPRMADVLDYLKRHPGRYVTSYEMAEYVYQDDEDGGPDNVRTDIHKIVMKNRPKMKGTGWSVSARFGYGGGYMLTHAQT